MPYSISGPGPLEYDVYREVFRITEWRDNAVFATVSLGYEWIPEWKTKQNNPGITNIIYAAPSDEFSKTHCTIRVAQ